MGGRSLFVCHLNSDLQGLVTSLSERKRTGIDIQLSKIGLSANPPAFIG
jgi:hypothetical protein